MEMSFQNLKLFLESKPTIFIMGNWFSEFNKAMILLFFNK